MSRGPFNPLDKLNLGKSVAEALLFEDVRPLAETGGLVGAGVYALYYSGDFPIYVSISEKNRGGEFKCPIYVGKAVPRGSRKGGFYYDASSGTALRDRLRTHAASVREASNIDLADFYFRALMVDDVWIPLGENMMIEQFKPIWNLVIDGFGNKTPGSRRFAQYKSQWDVLHPGRKFAMKQGNGGSTPETVSERLSNFFAGKSLQLLQPAEAVDQNDGDNPR